MRRMLKSTKVLVSFLVAASMLISLSAVALAGDGETATIAVIVSNQNSDGGWKKTYSETSGDWAKSTIDNKATYTEIRRLAKEFKSTNNTTYKNAAVKGINFLLNMQYANGGFPQIYNSTGYHMHITYNDNAMTNVVILLDDISKKSGDFSWVDSALASKCAAAVTKAINCIINTQIVSNGERQLWCQQHDYSTLKPTSARAYEPPGNVSSESVSILRFLMKVDNPSAALKTTIKAGVAYLNKVQIKGIRVEKSSTDAWIVQDPAAKPIWARYYEIGTNKPFFAGRDGVKKYSLAEIEQERRIGYSWYGYWPESLINTDYPAWLAKYPN